MSTDIRRVGMIGLGKMGLPMFRHLKKAGFSVIGCDVGAEARSAAEREGIKVAASVKFKRGWPTPQVEKD